jgi:hypothetical protein
VTPRHSRSVALKFCLVEASFDFSFCRAWSASIDQLDLPLGEFDLRRAVIGLARWEKLSSATGSPGLTDMYRRDPLICVFFVSQFFQKPHISGLFQIFRIFHKMPRLSVSSLLKRIEVCLEAHKLCAYIAVVARSCFSMELEVLLQRSIL